MHFNMLFLHRKKVLNLCIRYLGITIDIYWKAHRYVGGLNVRSFDLPSDVVLPCHLLGPINVIVQARAEDHLQVPRLRVDGTPLLHSKIRTYKLRIVMRLLDRDHSQIHCVTTPPLLFKSSFTTRMLKRISSSYPWS